MRRRYRVRVIRGGSGAVRYTGTVGDLPGWHLDLASALAAAVDLYQSDAQRIEVRAEHSDDVGEWDRERGVSFVVYYRQGGL